MSLEFYVHELISEVQKFCGLKNKQTNIRVVIKERCKNQHVGHRVCTSVHGMGENTIDTKVYIGILERLP